jgi:hypothetical protein
VKGCPGWTRALFAGHKAAGTITDAIENDPDTDVKKKAGTSGRSPRRGLAVTDFNK